jgi:prevent-host-death family protein
MDASGVAFDPRLEIGLNRCGVSCHAKRRRRDTLGIVAITSRQAAAIMAVNSSTAFGCGSTPSVPREVAFRNELVNNMVMGKVNIFEVKAKLSEYLDRAAAGERILICRHNTPVAELRPVDAARTTERPIGPLEGRPTFELPASFFEPMADDDVELWEGGGDAGTWPADTPRRPSRVAEAPGSYGTARGRRPAKRRR